MGKSKLSRIFLAHKTVRAQRRWHGNVGNTILSASSAGLKVESPKQKFSLAYIKRKLFLNTPSLHDGTTKNYFPFCQLESKSADSIKGATIRIWRETGALFNVNIQFMSQYFVAINKSSRSKINTIALYLRGDS